MNATTGSEVPPFLITSIPAEIWAEIAISLTVESYSIYGRAAQTCKAMHAALTHQGEPMRKKFDWVERTIDPWKEPALRNVKTRYMRAYKCHRDDNDKPAMMDTQRGVWEWRIYDRLHRDGDRPARIVTLNGMDYCVRSNNPIESGSRHCQQPLQLTWYRQDMPYRQDGKPNQIIVDDDDHGRIITQRWLDKLGRQLPHELVKQQGCYEEGLTYYTIVKHWMRYFKAIWSGVVCMVSQQQATAPVLEVEEEEEVEEEDDDNDQFVDLSLYLPAPLSKKDQEDDDARFPVRVIYK